MQFNHFDSTILGAIINGQGIVVVGTHRTTLRVLFAKFARSLSLRLGSWRALMRVPAGTTTAWWCPTPALATCPCYTAGRQQRHERWMSGVVVDPGTVGVR